MARIVLVGAGSMTFAKNLLSDLLTFPEFPELSESTIVLHDIDPARLATVEVPCHVDRAGVRPVRVDELPAQVAALNRTFLNVSELTVKAAREGRRDHVYQAAPLEPNTGATLPVRQVRVLVDEPIAAHGNLLPIGIRN